MAPIRPSPRNHSSSTAPHRSKPSNTPSTVSKSRIKNLNPKVLKRTSRHSALLARLQSTSKITKPRQRTRRRAKQRTDHELELGALGDALPDDDAGATVTGDTLNRDGGATGKRILNREEGKMRHKSLRSRPGAGKRKERLVALERERFARNMAVMARGTTGGGGEVVKGPMPGGRGEGDDDLLERRDERENVGVAHSSKERWAAIRRFIEQTMEKKDPDQS